MATDSKVRYVVSPWMDDNLNETTVDKATHVLMKVVENECVRTEIVRHHFKVEGQFIFGTTIICPGLTVSYAQLDAIHWMHSKIVARAGALYTGNARWLDMDLTGKDWYSQEKAASFTSSFPYVTWRRQFEREKITSRHIVHLRPEEVAPRHFTDKDLKVQIGWHDEGVRSELLRRVECMEGKPPVEVEMASWGTYARIAPLWAVKYVNFLVSHCKDRRFMYNMLKREGVRAKQMQGMASKNLSVIFELHVLQNRVYDAIDWADEKRKRARFRPHIDITRNEVTEIASRIFRAALSEGKTPISSTWNDYWSLRWSKTPTGSFVSQYEDDIAVKRKFSLNDNANKANVLAAMGKRSFLSFYNRKPMIYATTSTKYEWGKVRALYGCDVTSFLLSDFSMQDCDNCLPDYMPIGENAEESKVKRRVNGMKGGIPLCYDYDDFNAQHSVESMQGVLLAYVSVYGPYMSGEQKLALDWTIKSLGNMKVSCTQTSDQYKALGTLFSGWRLTSFINSVLNRVYLEKAGLKKKILYALHNGDDVFGVAESFVDVMQFMRDADALGLKAQKTKQNIGTIAEFLRIDLFAKEPTGSQYLTRACATVTHGRIESGESHSLDDEIKAVMMRGNALIARGGEVTAARALMRRQIEVKCKMYESEPEVYDYVRGLHPLQGGLNLNGDLTAMRVIRKSIVDVNEDMKLVMKGVNEYVDRVAELMKVEKYRISNATRERLASTTFKSSKMKLLAVKENRRNLISLKLVYRAHRHKFEIANLAKARLIGEAGLLALDRSNIGLAKVAARAQSPLAFISAIS